METSVKLYSLKHSNVKTYLFALLFVAGNIALPQLCHLVPYGGPTLLPIYFFTLIAAYKYGFLVSVSAILSCRPFFILIFLRCIKMKHYGFSRKSIWKNLETFP